MNVLQKLNPANNPVMVKELRSRMRGGRAFLILTVSLLALGGISYLVYLGVVAAGQWGSRPLAPQVGQALFGTLAYLEMLAICLITPAITSGAISSEYENLTYEMLLATPLRPERILWGKLLSALSYIFLLIFAAIPLASVVFIYGGVAPREMVKTLIVLVATAGMIGTLGVFNSALLKRTGRATALTGLVVLGITGLPLFVFIVMAIIRNGAPPRWPLVINPFSALASAMLSPAAINNPGYGIANGLSMLLSGTVDATFQNSIPRPIYHYTLPLYGALALTLYALASRLIRPTHRWRISPREWRAFVLWLLLLIGGAAAAFGLTAHRYEGISIFTAAAPPGGPAEAAVVVEEAVSPPPINGVVLELTLHDQAAIYSAALRQIYADNSIDGTFYVLEATDDSASGLNLPQMPSVTLAEDLQTEIQSNLTDTVAIHWVAARSEVPGLEDAGDTVTDGIFITLGNIQPLGGDSVRVTASEYASPTDTRGMSITLLWEPTGWTIISTATLERDE